MLIDLNVDEGRKCHINEGEAMSHILVIFFRLNDVANDNNYHLIKYRKYLQ